ncbi:MAG: hypothetical protein HYZ11_18145 [Candidatus Tectomicrobia bacterium]|uniref:Cysteine dioxygenase n=1 Tax=Tectimicrobiota bacterium TaxID=2528274 RepID=A0A932I2K1_UNCTE|nr:hypothetical protein [Candidatus Tectomicrobia bacterium]
MDKSLEAFAAECRAILKNDSGQGGLDRVCKRLEGLLKDESFVREHFGPGKDAPRRVLYEDPELGFCVLAHAYKGGTGSGPHDHGPSWAIYGQVEGVTRMTEYRKVAEPSDGRPGKAAPVKSYDLAPGMAVAYAPGQLHSPHREKDARLIRMEGMNMERVKRDAYEVA